MLTYKINFKKSGKDKCKKFLADLDKVTNKKPIKE